MLGVISLDANLCDRIAVVARAAETGVSIANDSASAESILTSPGFRYRVIDYRSRLVCAQSASDFLLFPERPCPAWDGTDTLCRRAVCAGPGCDRILLVSGSGHQAHRPLGPMRVAVYEEHSSVELLDELRALLPPVRREGEGIGLILGATPQIQKIRAEIVSVARFKDVPVLVLGETGTGKELVARAIHDISCGPDRPFVPVNCAAIPEALFESELFGHEHGAYTGASRARAGLLEAAADGTLFLDEVGEMPPPLQAKLLRALESKEFRRVGGNHSTPFRARVISATNRAVASAADAALRPDLYFRLAGVTLTLPPLRERLDDLGLLSAAFLKRFATRHRLPSRGFEPEALDELKAWPWPGNVRELKAIVERCAMTASGPRLGVEQVHAALDCGPLSTVATAATPPRASPPLAASAPAGARNLKDLERDLISDAFREADGNLSRAARALGIPRTTLRAKLRRLGML